MKKRGTGFLIILCLLAAALAAQADTLSLDGLMAEIGGGASKHLAVGSLRFAVSGDRQSIFVDRPEVMGSENYTIAYNIYDSHSRAVNYFYSLEERVAATPGYGGLFNVYVVVTDTATEEQIVQNTGWLMLDWPRADTLTVGPAQAEVSPDGRSIFVDRPSIACRGGRVTIAYNLYDAQGHAVNYFYSEETRVAVTPGYAGRFNVFVAVTDLVTGEQRTRDVGWRDLAGPAPEDDPSDFRYEVRGNGVIITGYLAKNAEVRIPSVIGGRPVTAIGEKAFFRRDFLKSVRIPSSVQSIGVSAFYGCAALTDVGLSEGLVEIQEGAFNFCTSLTSISIPDSVLAVCVQNFVGCENLRAIRVSERSAAYTTVDGVLFSKDKKTLVLYPGGLSGEYKVPSGVTRIGDYAFSCGCLSGVSVPEGVTRIGEECFAGCGNLQWAELPASLTEIGDYAFWDCGSMVEIRFGGTLAQWRAIRMGTDAIPDGVYIRFR